MSNKRYETCDLFDLNLWDTAILLSLQLKLQSCLQYVQNESIWDAL